MTADRLYFAQHGIAVSKTEDPERPLSNPGIMQTNSVAKQLHQSGEPVTDIFHSNKLRAQQTAEIFSSILQQTRTSVIDYLSPNDDIALIKPQLTSNNALYIGHLPHLGKLVSSLTAGDEELDIIKFHNSAVVCLEKNVMRYQILWYLTPQIILRS